MIDEIRKRIDPMPDNDKIVSMTYQLWFDCRYLLSELDYYKARCQLAEETVSKLSETWSEYD
jgi:hypothetical protein